MSKIEFYIPGNVTIPISMKLKYTDENGHISNVYYERTNPDEFYFSLICENETDIEGKKRIINDVINKIIMEQGEPEHGVTWETVSVDFYDTHLFASDLDAYWTFRIRDSY